MFETGHRTILSGSLERIVAYCGIPWNVIRSSSLNIPAELHGQDRVLEIARRLGARRYVNSPGGRHLYDPVAFANASIKLHFLPDFNGPTISILSRILHAGSQSSCAGNKLIFARPRYLLPGQSD